MHLQYKIINKEYDSLCRANNCFNKRNSLKFDKCYFSVNESKKKLQQSKAKVKYNNIIK